MATPPPPEGVGAPLRRPLPLAKSNTNKRQSLPPGALQGVVRGAPARGGRVSPVARGAPPARGRGHMRRGSALPSISVPPARPLPLPGGPSAPGGQPSPGKGPLPLKRAPNPLGKSVSSPAPAHGKPPPPVARRPLPSPASVAPATQAALPLPLKSNSDSFSAALAAAAPPPPLRAERSATISFTTAPGAASVPPPLAGTLVPPTTAAPEVPADAYSPLPSNPALLPPPMFSEAPSKFSKPKPKGRLGHRRSISTGSHSAIAKDTSTRTDVANRPTANMLRDQLTKIHLKQAEDIKAGKTPGIAGDSKAGAPVLSPRGGHAQAEEGPKRQKDRPGFISKSKTKLTSTTKKLKDSTVKRANSGSHQSRGRAATTVLKTSSPGVSARRKYTSVTLQQVLLLMGLKDVEHMQVIALVNSFCDSEFMQSEINAGELPVLQYIEDKTREIRQAESNTGKIVRAQAIVRGYLVRKQLRGVSGGERQRMLTFNRLCTNVMDMEKTYISSLQTLVNHYLQPLRARMAQGKDILRLEEISMIFSNVEVILESHQQNKRRLTSILEQWPFLSGIGKVFLQMGADLAAYGVYVGNFKTAQDTIIRLRSERGSKFNTWANEVQQAHLHAPDLLTLISLPVNHISRLEPLLEMLSRFCVIGSVEEKDLNNAYSMLHEANQFVAQSLLQSEATAEITNIQRRVVGYDKPLNLIKPDRTLVLEGAIVNPKRHIFLFNDLLLLTKPSGKSKFTFKEMQILELVSIQDVSGDKNTFLLKTPKEVHRLQTRGAEEKEKWMAAFAALKRKNRTIGLDVESIVKREGTAPDGIPTIVTDTISIVEKSIEMEGIFRISANQNELNSLVEIFDNCAPEDRDLSRYSVHAICGILKLWLRSLPEPLMTFMLYDRLVTAEREDVELYKEALKELKASSYNTFVYLIKFLFQVSTRSVVNKMNTTNLSIVFGPTLLRPETETIETTLNSPIVNGIVQRIIDNHDAIFA